MLHLSVRKTDAGVEHGRSDHIRLTLFFVRIPFTSGYSLVVEADRPRFPIALSFPHSKRPCAKEVAAVLKRELGEKSVFYDDDHQHQLAAPRLDHRLQSIYSSARLVVVFATRSYRERPWCKLEWKTIRRKPENILFVAFSGASVQGVYSAQKDGALRGDRLTPEQIAQEIIKRLEAKQTFSGVL